MHSRITISSVALSFESSPIRISPGFTVCAQTDSSVSFKNFGRWYVGMITLAFMGIDVEWLKQTGAMFGVSAVRGFNLDKQ
jgi:hypothetical protein